MQLTRAILFGATIAALAIPDAPVFAQGAIEEIIVTARKREESLQTVPIAVTAFTGADLQARGITSTTDLSGATPSLTVQQDPNAAGSITFTIRGQSNAANLINGDPSVGLYVDGVYVARQPGALVEFIDIERVEVLKGPQGTLFGRNTTGGAVSVTTRAPELDTYSLTARATAGTETTQNYGLTANVPLGEAAALRASYYARNHDGFGTSPISGQDMMDEEKMGLRGSIYWEASENLNMTLSGDWYQARESGPATVMTDFNPCTPLSPGIIPFIPGLPPALAVDNIVNQHLIGCGTGPTGLADMIIRMQSGFTQSAADFLNPTADTKDDFDVPMNGFTPNVGASVLAGFDTTPDRAAQRQESDSWGVSGTFNVDLGEFRTKAIFAYRSMSNTLNADYDGTPYDILNPTLLASEHQFTAEVQALGEAFDDRLEWILGAFYFTEEGYNFSHTFALNLINPANPSRLVQYGDNRSWAIFGQGTYAITDAIDFTGGVRYTNDKKGVSGAHNSGPFATRACSSNVVAVAEPGDGCFFETSDTFDAISFTAGLDWQAIDNANTSLLAYAKIAKGFRSGGQNGRSFREPNGYAEETVLSPEIGVKTDLFGNRLRLNVSAFQSDYKDIQQVVVLATPEGNTDTFLFNAASATIKGVELEATINPAAGLLFGGTMAYLDAGFDDFTDPTTLVDRSNEMMPRTPEWEYSLYGQYSHSMDHGDYTLRADWAWRDEVNFAGGDTDLHPSSLHEAYGLLNSRLSLDVADSGLEIAVFCNNCTDQQYFSTGVNLLDSVGYSFALVNGRRIVGGEFSWHFGG